MGSVIPQVKAAKRDYLSMAFPWLVVFFVVYSLRPEDFVPLGGFPIAKISGFLAVASFGLVVMSRPDLLRFSPEMKYLAAIVALLLCGVPFASVWRGGAFKNSVDFSKILPIALLVGLVADSLPRIRRLIFVQTASLILVVVLTLITYRFHASEDHRLGGVINGPYGNPNDLAFAITLMFPFCAMFMLSTRNLLFKGVWVLAMGFMSLALLLTYSRGGMLALLTSGTILLWEFGIKGKRYGLLALVGAGALCFVAIVGPKGYANRIISIVHPSADTGAAEGSWEARRALLIQSLVVTAEHPLFGVGCGNFMIVSGDWHVAHNSYTEMSADAGIPALILYLMILWRTRQNLRESEKYTRGSPDLELTRGALRASFVALLTGSFFASVTFNLFPYFLIAHSGAFLAIAKSYSASRSPVESTKEQGKFFKRSMLGRLIGKEASSLTRVPGYEPAVKR